MAKVSALESEAVMAGYEIETDARPEKWTVTLRHTREPQKFTGVAKQNVFGERTNEALYAGALSQAVDMMRSHQFRNSGG